MISVGLVGHGGDTGPNKAREEGGARWGDWPQQARWGDWPQQSARPAPIKRFRRCLTVRRGARWGRRPQQSARGGRGAVGTPAPTGRGRGGDAGPNKARDWPQLGEVLHPVSYASHCADQVFGSADLCYTLPNLVDMRARDVASFLNVRLALVLVHREH